MEPAPKQAQTARRPAPDEHAHWAALARDIHRWGRQLGFAELGITDTDLGPAGDRLNTWLAAGLHGEMGYMARHGRRRTDPAELVAGTLRVICVRVDYRTAQARPGAEVIDDPARAFVARYALGRDYHKLIRGRLQRLATRIEAAIGPFGYRAFADSAPVMEKPLAEKAGLGWIGKHTNLLHRDAGSWFLLGELFVDLPLPIDRPASAHCGSCQACVDACPTAAIIGPPWRVDARRCISYLTIELDGPIPEPLRAAIGNRVFGCDDCQLVCPFNRESALATLADFAPRHGLDSTTLVELFAWSEAEWLERTAGSALRRTGYVGWLRNLAVGLGNAPVSGTVLAALRRRENHPSALVREHVAWALARQCRGSIR
ncbi:MAG: tRNA epoxyqueuosine(34) reductase QueG [Chromatiales bacterium]|nr:tRNA epoxyqueuosine(34) reductase QueG [Chromatiales bacterium]